MSKPKVYGSTNPDALAIDDISIAGKVWTYRDLVEYPTETMAAIATAIAKELAKPEITYTQMLDDGVTYTEEEGFTTTITGGDSE